MRKLLSFTLAIALILSSLFSVSLVVSAETDSDAWIAKQSMFTGSIWGDTFAWRDLSEVDFNTLGTNLITDPTVGNFEGDEYPEYYGWATKDTSTPVNPDAWWDRPALAWNGFAADPITNKYTSARYSGYVLNDTSLSHTNDGSGVLKIASPRKSAYLPLAGMEKYSYYAITFWMKASDADYGGDIKFYSAPESTELLAINQARLVQIEGTNKWIRYTALIYTGNKAWTQPAITIPGSKATTYYFDDFGMYKLDEEYGASCIEAGYLLPNIVPEVVPSDEWSAKQSIHTGSVWNDTFAWRDLSNVYFDSLGKNLITDPTVANFKENGYSEYYDWETRDASTVLDPKAWWDKPVITYNGFEMEPLQAIYASARYSGYVCDDASLSHTKDGSGVLKIVKGSNKSNYLPLSRMEKYSYYTITFWVKSSQADFDGGDLAIYSAAGSSENILVKINQARISQLKSGWQRYTFLIYTGSNTWSQPAIFVPGTKNTTFYFDDFGMYKLDETYGAACVEAGYMLNTEDYIDYATGIKGICLNNVVQGKGYYYVEGYENVDWSQYGKSVYADSNVSRFDENGNYLDYDSNKLAMLDRPVETGTSNPCKSPAERGYVTADTSYSHTADGSGAVCIPISSSGNAITQNFRLPELDKYGFYVVSLWIRNPEITYGEIALKTDMSQTVFQNPVPLFVTTDGVEPQKDYWIRATFMIYTGKAVSRDYVYLSVAGIKNATVDEIEVWKLEDEAFAKECMEAKRLIIGGDLDGSMDINAVDIASLRKELLAGSVNLIKASDVNTDGVVNLKDLVNLKKRVAGIAESYYKYCSSEMLTASKLYTGDTQRLSYKIKQALADKGQNTTIAVLGDSITYGAGASSTARHYSTKFKNWWSENISSSVTLVRRGSGATNSYLGVHWVDEAVLAHNPDIIFIEYVNDTNDNGTLQAMDSLVRKCLALENKPAVILLEMAYYGTQGEGVLSNAQETHLKVAEAYGVPVISWRDAVEVGLDSQLYKWTDVSSDEVHPNNTGNAMLAEMMVYLTSGLVANSYDVQEPTVFDTPAITSDKFKNATIMAKDEVTVLEVDEGCFTDTINLENENYNKFEEGWATTTGGSITFELEFKNLGIVCQRTSDDLNGKIKIEIDGVEITTVNGDNASGWGSFNFSQEIKTFTEWGKHTVKVTVVDDDVRKAFQIVGWLVS